MVYPAAVCLGEYLSTGSGSSTSASKCARRAHTESCSNPTFPRNSAPVSHTHIQVCAVSSAGVAFTYIKEVPALTLASWRLQLTAVITAIAGSVQWATGFSAEHKARFWRDLHLTALSGLALTLHFGTWVWSLQVRQQMMMSEHAVVNCAAGVLSHQVVKCIRAICAAVAQHI